MQRSVFILQKNIIFNIILTFLKTSLRPLNRLKLRGLEVEEVNERSGESRPSVKYSCNSCSAVISEVEVCSPHTKKIRNYTTHALQHPSLE
jgi:hypothetical protein